MVKVCGITSASDLELAERAGADYVGFVVDPGSRRFVPMALALELGSMCQHARPVLVARKLHAPNVPTDFVRQANEHVDPSPEAVHWLSTPRETDPPSFVKALLLDAHGEDGMGGTGNRVDLRVAAEAVRSSRIPVILAGGLRPDNVAAAIEAVKPAGVDACSGTEREPGIKDPGLLEAYVRIAQEALRTAHRDP